MTQVEDEYELVRDGTTYQLSVEYDWCYYPTDLDGCPEMPKGAPLVYVEHAWVLATWPEGSEDESEGTTYEHPNYPELEPPMTPEEVKRFDEMLCDKAAGAAEDASERRYR